MTQDPQALRRVELFVQAGVDINAINSHNETALYIASESKIVEYMIRNGADPGVYNISGNNALSRATQRNNHALIRLLLNEKQDHTKSLKNYGTFLHLAAEFANTETLRLLTQGALQHRPINIKNRAGLTPIQLAIRRCDVDDEWRAAFFKFLGSVDN